MQNLTLNTWFHPTSKFVKRLGEPKRIDNISLYQLTMNGKQSMLYIPEALRHYSE